MKLILPFFRYRLRTFLILVSVFAVWLSWHVHATRVQKNAVEKIREYGGWVRYDFQFPGGDYHSKKFDPNAEPPFPIWLVDTFGIDFFHSVVAVNLVYNDDGPQRKGNGNTSDGILEYISELRGVRTLAIRDTQATDDSLRWVRKMDELEWFFFWDASSVSDKGVENLQTLKNLKYVHLSNSQISDESMKTFSKLPKLHGLSLQGNRFTDLGLKHICTATNLKQLVVGLGDNSISDTGLIHLRSMKNLEKLGLQRAPGITNQGIRELKKHLPNLTEAWLPEGVSL